MIDAQDFKLIFNVSHDSDEILIGTNEITRQGEASKVLNVAKVQDGKVYEFHHLRAPI